VNTQPLRWTVSITSTVTALAIHHSVDHLLEAVGNQVTECRNENTSENELAYTLRLSADEHLDDLTDSALLPLSDLALYDALHSRLAWLCPSRLSTTAGIAWELFHIVLSSERKLKALVRGF